MRMLQLIEVVYRNLWLVLLALAVVAPLSLHLRFRSLREAELAADTSHLPNQNAMFYEGVSIIFTPVLFLLLLACALMLKPKGFWFWTPAQKRTSA
ncbi:MAG: hypothetical protein AAF612_00220 [Planctomycetota bacterium]